MRGGGREGEREGGWEGRNGQGSIYGEVRVGAGETQAVGSVGSRKGDGMFKGINGDSSGLPILACAQLGTALIYLEC